ncbi:biotin synthase-like enzyme [Bradyrhizobium sp. USDA 4518]
MSPRDAGIKVSSVGITGKGGCVENCVGMLVPLADS